MQKSKWLAGALAAIMLCGAGVPASAASAPTISKTSKTDTSASAYQYWLFDPENTALYRNEVFCAVEKLSVQADNQKYYYLTDLSELENSKAFSLSLKSSTNAQYVKSLRTAPDEMKKPDRPSFAVKLTENAVLDPLTLGYNATYTALTDTELSVREAGKTNSDQTLSVARGAKLTFAVSLRIEYDKLLRFNTTPRYAADLTETRSVDWASGISSDTMTAEKGDDSDYAWTSLGRICAELNVGSATISTAPKLSAIWRDGDLRAKFTKGNAFYRSFAASTVDGKVTLKLTNPFVTIDGKESIAHSKVKIYEVQNGKPVNVTKQFRYGENSDGEGAFYTTTDHLGTYIITDVTPS